MIPKSSHPFHRLCSERESSRVVLLETSCRTFMASTSSRERCQRCWTQIPIIRGWWFHSNLINKDEISGIVIKGGLQSLFIDLWFQFLVLSRIETVILIDIFLDIFGYFSDGLKDLKWSYGLNASVGQFPSDELDKRLSYLHWYRSGVSPTANAVIEKGCHWRWIA